MIKDTGIIRCIDGVGRVVLPVELRNKLDINVKDELRIFVKNKDIILRKEIVDCILCGSTIQLITYHNKLVCENCIIALVNHI